MSTSGVSVNPEKVEAVRSWEKLNVNLRDTLSLGIGWYYRRFENGLKLSIRGRIVGLRLRDMDSMVVMALTIEREIEDARMRVLVARGRISFLLVRRRGRRLLLHTSFRTRARIRHVRRDYPQRQGSQDFGTMQS